MARDVVFNPRRLRLLRQRIPLAENAAVLIVIALLVGLVAWVLGRKDSYDATARDLPIEMLYVEREPIELYTLPLKRWNDPAVPAALARQFDFKLFPPSVEDAMWVPDNRVRTFSAETLFEKINGEAPKFLRQGFRELQYLVLKSNVDGSELAMELFDQSDIGGSLGVFSAHVTGGRDVRTDGELTYFLTSAGVIGRIGQYFFRIAGDRESAAITDKTTRLLTDMSSLVKAGGIAKSADPPGMTLLLRVFDLSKADVAFEAKNVFQFDFATQFWFGNLKQLDKARAFVHIAQTQDEAHKLFAQLVEEQSYDFAVTEQTPTSAVLRHEFLNTFFALAQTDTYIYGVQNVPAESAVSELMERWRAGLVLDAPGQSAEVNGERATDDPMAAGVAVVQTKGAK